MGILDIFYRGAWIIEEATGKKTRVDEELIIGSNSKKCRLWIPEPEIKSVHAIVGLFGKRYVIGCKDKDAIIYFNPEDHGWSRLQSDKIYATLGKEAQIQLGGYRTDVVERRVGEKLAEYAKTIGEDFIWQKPESEPRPGCMLRFGF